jgi:thiamine transport system permease protein
MVRFRWLIQLAVVVFVGVGVVAPLLTVLWAGLNTAGPWPWALLRDVLGATIGQALLSTLLAAGLAVPVIWAMHRRPGRSATWAWLAVTLPFVVPTPVAVTMVYAVCAPSRWCQHWFDVEVIEGLWVVVIVHAWYNTGVVVRLVGDAWQSINQRYLATAATLGSTPWQAFRRVVLPLLAPAILGALLLVFLYCVGSFGVVWLLGGRQLPALEVEIWRQTSQLLRLDVATSLALWQLGLSLVLIVAIEWMQRRTVVEPVRLMGAGHLGRGATLAALINVVTTVVFVAPMVALVPRAIVAEAPWRAFVALTETVRGSGIFVTPLAALWRSLVLACMVAVTSMAVAGLVAPLARGWRALLVWPLGISAVTLSLGYLLWFGSLGLLLAPWLVVLAHMVVALPLVSRQVALAFDRLSPQYDAVAATLGAPLRRRVVDVWWPLLRRPLLSATLLAFTISFGDFATALLLTRPDTATAPVFIARLLGRPGTLNATMAAALSLVVLLVCVSAMWAAWACSAERTDPDYEGGRSR